MNALFVLVVFGTIIWGIGWVLWKLLKMPLPPPPAADGGPPDPGKFDRQKYVTPQEQEQYFVAYSRRVNWERTQPREPSPAPLSRAHNKSEVA
jgi:hypothetical protein